MLVTVAAAFASDYVQGEAYWLIPACIVPCALFGVWYANSVVTDRLPELVGLFNSFGGLAAALEGIAVYTDRTAVLSMYSGAPLDRTEQKVQLVVLYLSIIIGMATFTGSVIAVLKLTAAWPKYPHSHAGVVVDAQGVATFRQAHKVRKGKTDKKTGRNVDSDIVNKLDAKDRQNRYAAEITITPDGHDPDNRDGPQPTVLTAFDILDSKKLQLCKKRGKAADELPDGFAGCQGTATWEHETENFWHINSKPRFLLGGVFPQVILCLGMLACCVITYHLDKAASEGEVSYEEGGQYFSAEDETLGTILIIVLAVQAGLLGILQAMAVSGADMAVVICVLNSGSGWSGVAAGFMISNELLLVTGAFVGASGAILSYLMCEAMNVPILRVLGMVSPPKKEKKDEEEGEALPDPVKEDATQVAQRLREASTIIIAPGYGMAAGKAQGVVGKLAETLRGQGKTVRFCIHPVAGRLPGHMNILLAEAQVPYDWVCAMEEINPDFKNTDVALCVGAWDTVNPAAAEDPDCPVYGMPMCRVWDAKICVVNKRSLGAGTGFSGAQNILPHKENTRMLLGSAADQVQLLLDDLSKDAKAEGTGNEAGGAAAAAATGPSAEELAAMPTYKTICVPKETSDPTGGPLTDEGSELRCALSPKAALHLRKKLGFHIKAESGLGVRSLYTDEMYAAVGVEIVKGSAALYKDADVLLKLNPPIERKDCGGKHELEMMSEGATYISFLPIMPPGDNPSKCCPQFKDIVLRAQDCKINLLSMGHLPRISRAQKSDAISTFGKLAGHRACIEAAAAYGRIMPGEITSAGKNPQAKAWVGGCGVAGLEAVAILKKMGCDVYATDVRDIEDQIISVGGKFVHYDPEGLKAAKDSGGYAPKFDDKMQTDQDAMYTKWSAECNIMVMTAAVPGMPPPRLVTKEMVDNMQPGSVIVDIAASAQWAAEYAKDEKAGNIKYSGPPFGPKRATPWPGNCEYTKPGELFVTPNGVKIVGYTDMPSRFGSQATDFYANNLVNLLEDMCVEGTLAERGIAEPVLGTANDFKIDMQVVRCQDEGHDSYAQGEFAIGDDIMAGMCLVQVDGDKALLDCPKKRKPMETPQAIFEKSIKGQGLDIAGMQGKLGELEKRSAATTGKLMAAHGKGGGIEAGQDDALPSVSDTVKSISDPAAKVDAALLFAEQKQHADEVKWLNGMIKKAKQEAAKADKERRLLELQRKKDGGGFGMYILGALGLVREPIPSLASCVRGRWFPDEAVGTGRLRGHGLLPVPGLLHRQHDDLRAGLRAGLLPGGERQAFAAHATHVPLERHVRCATTPSPAAPYWPRS